MLVRLGIVAAGVLILVVSIAARAYVDNALWVVAATAGLLIIAGWVVHLIVRRRIARPMGELNRILEQMTDGRFDVPLSRETADTYPQLAESLAKMSVIVSGRIRHLKAQRDQLRMVIDSLVEGVIAVDADQRIILVGVAARRMFGLSEGSSIGRPIWELVRNPQLQEWIAVALRQPDPIRGEMHVRNPEDRILAISVARLTGQPAPGAVVVAHDITEIRRLEKVRQEFVANASHELKTPITSIRAYVETLLNGAIDDEEHRWGFLKTIDEQAERLDATVRDLLTLAHIEAEGITPDAVPTDVAIVISRCEEHHRPAAERKNVTVTAQPPADPVIVAMGAEPLETVLSNLVDNAIKYTAEGGNVSVTWTAENAYGVVAVQDTGVGIPQKHLSRIFERFYRVDRGRSRDQGGTGLGLAIVKHLVQSAGGTVTVASQVNRGTTFSVRLPLEKKAKSPQ